MSTGKMMSQTPKVVSIIIFMLVSTIHLHAGEVCSNRDLAGAFGFSVSGTNFVASVQFAIAGRFVADGKGNFAGQGTENVAGNVFPVRFTGTYTITSDCSGTSEFVFETGSVAHLEFIVVDDGNELLITVSDQGTLENGTAKKQFRRRHASRSMEHWADN